MLTEFRRTDESIHKSSHTSNYKETSERGSKDRFARVGGTVPISIKFKKLADEEAISRQQDNCRKERFQHECGKAPREPPPIEMGPKRLKVRGPSFIGSDRSD